MDVTSEPPGHGPESGHQCGRGGAVASVVTRAKAMALTWDAVGTVSDEVLERTLAGPKLVLTVARPGHDLVWMLCQEARDAWPRAGLPSTPTPR